MRLLILGATGRVGRPTVDRALSDGHDVVAYVRSSASVVDRDRLSVVEGDIRDGDGLRRAAMNADAAICLIASSSMRDGDLLQTITPGIVAAVRDAGVERFVFASVFGVGPTLPLASAFARTLYRTVARPFMTDRAVAERAVEKSGLDYAIIHLLNLNDLPRVDYDLVPTSDIRRVKGLPRFPYLSAADAVIEAATTPDLSARRLLVASSGQWDITS